MMNYKLYLKCIVLLVLVAACSKSKKKPEIIFDMPVRSVTIPALGGEEILDVDANVDWNVDCEADWITAVKLNNDQLKITVSATIPGRSAGVICRVDDKSISVTVTQMAAPATQADSLALVALYRATGGETWANRWTLSQPVKQWYGVIVSGGRVTELDLHANNLVGTLPAEINYLTELKYLDLFDNALSGELPDLGKLTKLIIVDLSHNQFSGTLSAWISKLSSLAHIELRNNYLQGELPAGLKNLPNLHTLDLSHNAFSGTMPAAWSSLTKLRICYLYANELSGELPSYLSNFSNLDSLALDGNNFTGTVPNGLGNITSLSGLWLRQNQLTGSVPGDLLNNANWNRWRIHVVDQQNGVVLQEGTQAPAQLQSRSFIRELPKPRKER